MSIILAMVVGRMLFCADSQGSCGADRGLSGLPLGRVGGYGVIADRGDYLGGAGGIGFIGICRDWRCRWNKMK